MSRQMQGKDGTTIIPDILEKKVKRCFGPKGHKWLEQLPGLLAACSSKWNLTEVAPSPVMSFNLVCFAQSPAYGPVVLKIGVPHLDLFTEMEALRIYGGRNICKIFDWDAELGAMLLERVMPGEDLLTIKNSSERIKVAATLAAALPLPVTEHSLPTLAELMDEAFARQRREQTGGKKMLELIDAAQNLYRQLAADRPQLLLHGDLNHWNILSNNGRWQAIDPKGIIGPACMEPARFMLNELELSGREPLACLDEMTAILSNKLGEHPRIVATAAFLDAVLSTCWTLEEHQQRDRTEEIERCCLLHRYLTETLS